MAKAGKGKAHHSGAHGDARLAITRRNKTRRNARLLKRIAKRKPINQMRELARKAAIKVKPVREPIVFKKQPMPPLATVKLMDEIAAEAELK